MSHGQMEIMLKKLDFIVEKITVDENLKEFANITARLMRKLIYREEKEYKAKEFVGKNQPTNELLYLKEWSGMNEFRIIYDSDQQPVEQPFLKQTLVGKEHVSLLFETTTNELFGCYLEAPIYINEYGCSHDGDMFIYSLRSPILSKPTRFVRNYKQEPIPPFSMYFADSDEYLIDIDGAFLIYIPLNSNISEINNELTKTYKNAQKEVFTSKGKEFVVKRIIVLQGF